MFHVKPFADTITKLVGQKRISRELTEALEQYRELVRTANSKINLVSRAGDTVAEIERQTLLSLALISRLPKKPLRWLDIGSGGGFPAIPLAICRPDDSFDLIESISKKAFFLERTVAALNLSGVRILNDRAERYLAIENPDRRRYDWLTIKAVGGWKDAFSWGAAALHPGGMLATFKPMDNDPDVAARNNSYSFELVENYSIRNILPEVTARILLFKKSA
jgi:16S rRNA (guanine527-N7)-methyltransferase